MGLIKKKRFYKNWRIIYRGEIVILAVIQKWDNSQGLLFPEFSV